MAAIVDTDNQLDLDALVDGMRKSLPVYARPLFLRVMKSLPMTGLFQNNQEIIEHQIFYLLFFNVLFYVFFILGTYKLKKKDLLNDSYDPAKIDDALYFLDASSNKFVILTPALYQDIITNKIRL